MYLLLLMLACGPGTTDDLPESICDGRDDDADGSIDEGWPDVDGDRVADCVDPSCPVPIRGRGLVQADASCLGFTEPLDDPWDITLEWHWQGLKADPDTKHVLETPVAAELNGRPCAEIAVVAYAANRIDEGWLVLLDGCTGREIWSRQGYAGGTGVVMADLDGVAGYEVLAFTSEHRLAAHTATGELLWTAKRAGLDRYPHATVFDLDEDGVPEVVADTLLLDGATGEELVDLNASNVFPGIDWRLPVAADAQGDGKGEILLGHALYDHKGEVLWETDITGKAGAWTSFANVDRDPQAEVVMLGTGRLGVFELDGTKLLEVVVSAGEEGPPTIADLDGDGTPEIAWGDLTTIYAAELNGEIIWSREGGDSSGRAGASAFDFDGDGDYELVYADHETLWILDGRTGETLWSDPDHASSTLQEYPAIVDCDSDGSAELLVAGSSDWMSGRNGVSVLGHAQRAWSQGSTEWTEHAQASPWQTWNTVRAAQPEDAALSDLAVEVLGACAASCAEGGTQAISVVVSNKGLADSEPWTPLTVSRGDEILGTWYLPSPIPAGQARASQAFQVPTGPGALSVTVSTGGDCHPENDSAGWEALCPN